VRWRFLASRSWTRPNRDWLQRITNPPRLNKLFGGEIDGVLQQFQRELWAA